MPLGVTVVLPVYNGARFLRDAIDSVLSQTYQDTRLLVIDDGSEDHTPKIIESYKDARIVSLKNERNIGLAATLNRAFDQIETPLIARLDTDDIAHPERIATQVKRFETDPELGILGTACRLIDKKGDVIGETSSPQTDLEIRWRNLTGNPFFHPTVMLRTEVLDKHKLRFDESFQAAQDYEFWGRVLQHCKGANLEAPLVDRRLHEDTITNAQSAKQREGHLRAAKSAIENLGLAFPDTTLFDLLLHYLSGTASPEQWAAPNRTDALGFYGELLSVFEEKHGPAPFLKQERFTLLYLLLHAPSHNRPLGQALSLLARHPSLAITAAKKAILRG